jgi:hypothetical protein
MSIELADRVVALAATKIDRSKINSPATTAVASSTVMPAPFEGAKRPRMVQPNHRLGEHIVVGWP